MIVQFVKFKSGLSDDEVRNNIEERGPQFRALSGIIQKFYVQEKDTGEWAGIYIWDSEESMQAFRGSDLARSIPGVYKVEGTPRVEVFDLFKPLRPEVPEPSFKFK